MEGKIEVEMKGLLGKVGSWEAMHSRMGEDIRAIVALSGGSKYREYYSKTTQIERISILRYEMAICRISIGDEPCLTCE